MCQYDSILFTGKNSMPFHGSGRFPTTAWTMVQKAQDPQSPERLVAMNRCLAGYWRRCSTIYVCGDTHCIRPKTSRRSSFCGSSRRTGYGRLIQRGGRFRTFLLTILKRFLSDQGPDQRRGKRRSTINWFRSRP